MTKKKLFVAAVAVSLIAILSLGTLAWFTDSKSVTNNFYVATSDLDDADEVFSVALTETEAGPYNDVLPGDTLAKNPTVQNTGYYDQYIRVTMTITKANEFIEYIAGGDSTLRSDVFVGFDATQWESPDNFAGVLDATKNEIVYTLYYNGILESEETVTVFTAVNMSEDLTRDEAAAFNSGATGETSFDITLVADAVQTENVGAVDTATDATNAATAFATVE